MNRLSTRLNVEESKVDRQTMESFAERGYAVVKALLDLETDLNPLIDEYSALLDKLAHEWYREGRMSDTYSKLPFGERFTRILAEVNLPLICYVDISLAKVSIAEQSPKHHGPAVFNLIRNSRLLDAVECFIGPEIYSNPIQHVRIKPPERLVPKHRLNALTAATPWHQDLGVTKPEADDSDILTVWIPITEASPKNGCLLVIPGSHNGELLPHCRLSQGIKSRTEPHIREQFIDLDKAVCVPVRPGDAVFIHKRTIHGSLPNNSDTIRWSFDFRYNRIGQATGRPQFPGFVARSFDHPSLELNDPVVWASLWDETQRRLIKSDEGSEFHRWELSERWCA